MCPRPCRCHPLLIAESLADPVMRDGLADLGKYLHWQCANCKENDLSLCHHSRPARPCTAESATLARIRKARKLARCPCTALRSMTSDVPRGPEAGRNRPNRAPPVERLYRRLHIAWCGVTGPVMKWTARRPTLKFARVRLNAPTLAPPTEEPTRRRRSPGRTSSFAPRLRPGSFQARQRD